MLYTDIYTTINNKYKKYKTLGIHDQSNLIFINKKELICSKCDNPTIYLYDISKEELLCPQCFFNIFGTQRKCKNCFRKVGCDSCGGKSEKMIKINNISLCLNDNCLNSFGYELSFKKNIKCTCDVDLLNIVSNHLHPHLNNIVKKFLFSNDENIEINNLRKINNYCTPCKNPKKYKSIGEYTIYKGNYLICNC